MEDPQLLLPQLEIHLLKPEVRADKDAVASLLAEDFREFGASGKVWSRSEILAELAAESPMKLEATDFKVSMLSESIALVTYGSTRSQPGQPSRHALRSSIWQLQEGNWRMLFHQGTVVQEVALS